MSYHGDLAEDATLYFEFPSRQFSSGAPFTLAGTPSLAVYKDDSLTQITAGITLTVDHDGVTGANNVKIDTSADAAYVTGSDYSVRIAAGTVDSVSVVGEKVGSFSIENRFAEVTATSVTDKTGYSLASTGLDAISQAATGMVEIAKAIWDRALTGATHNIANSAGRRLRNVQDFGIYDMASVWVDEVAGTSTGTTDGEDATVANRADDFDNAQTVAASVGLDHIHVQNGNTITLSATLNGYWVWGELWTLALGGQDIGSSAIQHATVSGVGTGTTPTFWGCTIGTATLPPCKMSDCNLTATLTLGSGGAYRLYNCYSGVAGSGSPTIDMGAAVGATTLEVRKWSGGLTINNLAAGDVVTLGGTLGTVTLNGADASVEIRGTYKALVNNLTGSPTVNTDGAILAADVAAVLVDTGATLPASLATAQADLDTLTGSDGATLATAQGNYAPSKAGDAMALTSGERDSIAAALLDLANGVETGWTLRQSLRIIAASVGGTLSGAATTTNTINDITDTKARITATVDADGNRSAVTLDAT